MLAQYQGEKNPTTFFNYVYSIYLVTYFSFSTTPELNLKNFSTTSKYNKYIMCL